MYCIIVTVVCISLQCSKYGLQHVYYLSTATVYVAREDVVVLHSCTCQVYIGYTLFIIVSFYVLKRFLTLDK